MSARDGSSKAPFNWAVLLLSLPAGVAIWSGWVGIGTLCGFGKVTPLPGLLDGFVIDTRVTLPIGMETYAALALRAWLTSRPGPTRVYAKWSALAALAVGSAGQVAYHLMSAAGYTAAPWPVTVAVATLPVAVLGMGGALHHLTTHDTAHDTSQDTSPDGLDVPDAGEGRAKTAKTAKTPFVQVSGPEFRHTRSAKTPASGAKTPSGTPGRTSHRAAGSAAAAAELAARVQALAAENPTWTQAQIGAEAGCSVRTVRRHLSAPASAPAVLEPVPTSEAATEDAA